MSLFCNVPMAEPFLWVDSLSTVMGKIKTLIPDFIDSAMKPLKIVFTNFS